MSIGAIVNIIGMRRQIANEGILEGTRTFAGTRLRADSIRTLKGRFAGEAIIISTMERR